jgi:chromosome segregation ATPase
MKNAPLQAVAVYATNEASTMAELARLTSSTEELRKERDAALESIASLNARLSSTTGHLESSSANRSSMENLNIEVGGEIDLGVWF